MSKMTLEQMGNEVGSHLNVLAELFQPGMKLTFIARLPGNAEADFVLSNDHIHEVGKLVERRIGATELSLWSSPESTPNIPLGTEKQYWIAVKNDAGKIFTYTAYYQNRPAELGDDEESEEDWVLHDSDGEPHHSVGWMDCREHYEFDSYYTQIEFSEKYVLIGWAECIPPALMEEPK